jgi:DNA-directed RNA polymerase specialized sigma subunit
MLDNEPNELERRLKKLILTLNQEFIADRIFQLNDRRKWTIYQLTKEWLKFRSGNSMSPTRDIVMWQNVNMVDILEFAVKKVKSAIKLSIGEQAILRTMSPWYQRLFSVYPRLSETDIDEFNKNCRGERPAKKEKTAGRVKKRTIKKQAKKDEMPIDALVLWKQALAGSRISTDNELVVPASALNQEMLERVFCRGLEIVSEAAKQLRYLGESYGFEQMDLIQEAGAVWWMMLKDWPGGTVQEFDAFVRETARTAIRGMFSHPALSSPISAIPLAELRKFVKQAVKHQLTYGEELSLPELREQFGWSDEQFSQYQDLTRLSWRHFILITEAAFDDDKKGERREVKISSKALNPEEVVVDFQRTVAKELLVAWLEDSLNQLLAPLEQLILRYRFGFDAEEPQTKSVEEVAKILNTPAPVIVRLEDQALAKLRDNEELKKRYQVSLQLLKQSEKIKK